MMDADSEEARLTKLLNKKANDAFEKKRREALQQYQAKTGNQTFQLAVHTQDQDQDQDHDQQHSTKKPTSQQQQHNAHPATTAPLPKPQTVAIHNDNWQQEQERKHRELQQQEEKLRKQAEIEKETEIQRQKQIEMERARCEEFKSIQQTFQETQPKPHSNPTSAPSHSPETQEDRKLCATCKKPFESVIDVYVVNNTNYCKSCSALALREATGHQKIGGGTGNICAQCHQAIDGRVIKALNRKYHPDCLVCSKCGGKIVVQCGSVTRRFRRRKWGP